MGALRLGLSMSWFVLASICAISLAAADALTKKWLSDRDAAELTLVRVGLAGLMLLPWLLVHPPGWPPPVFWLWVGAALPLEVLAMVLYVRALRLAPLALTLPFLAFTPVFTAAIGWLLLGERLSLQGLAGVLLVSGGAYVLHLDRVRLKESHSWLSPFAAIRDSRGSRLMLVVALIYGLTSVLGKGAMQYMNGLSFGALYFAALGGFTVSVVALARPRALAVLYRPGPKASAVAAAMAVMAFTHFLALESVETAYMIAVKRTSILFGLLFGHWLFGDRRLWQHLGAAALMLCGAALLAFSRA